MSGTRGGTIQFHWHFIFSHIYFDSLWDRVQLLFLLMKWTLRCLRDGDYGAEERTYSTQHPVLSFLFCIACS